MRNQLAVDLALAGQNIVPDPVPPDSATQLELPLDSLEGVEEPPTGSEVDRDPESPSEDAGGLDEDFEPSLAP